MFNDCQGMVFRDCVGRVWDGIMHTCRYTCVHLFTLIQVLRTSNGTFGGFFSLSVFKDSSQKDLLNFTGTIPVMYQGKYENKICSLSICERITYKKGMEFVSSPG